jgi:hypothetical protein
VAVAVRSRSGWTVVWGKWRDSWTGAGLDPRRKTFSEKGMNHALFRGTGCDELCEVGLKGEVWRMGLVRRLDWRDGSTTPLS